jgi:hypothetical protein
MLVDRKGNARPLSEVKREFRIPRFSPDGTRIAVAFREGQNQSVWVFDLRKSRFDRLSFEKGGPRCPAWSADGKRVAFDQGPSVFSMPADGSGSPEILFSSATLECPGLFVPGEIDCDRGGFPDQADISIVRLMALRAWKFHRHAFSLDSADSPPTGVVGCPRTNQQSESTQPFPQGGGVAGPTTVEPMPYGVGTAPRCSTARATVFTWCDRNRFRFNLVPQSSCSVGPGAINLVCRIANMDVSLTGRLSSWRRGAAGREFHGRADRGAEAPGATSAISPRRRPRGVGGVEL